ncbi:DUF1877 family protein [Streptomyces olivochromogenes]|uniref:DUF1877 family protein n=1 Tax=Streptomyces olivochromogenes TaxID=1963 RepID=UPI001F1DAD13|nr:DUF1877 family protein [Streptomyces olivochromogenes]MCF3133931.1 DUF1877 family protein [Streptomyces olivochromogenes]
MNMYFHLRAVPPPALRNSTTWLRKLFEDDWDSVRTRVDRHREEMLDRRYLDHDLLYAGAPPYQPEEEPCAQVILGGRPVFPAEQDKPPFLLLTAAQVSRVSDYLSSTDFGALWHSARRDLLPRYGGAEVEPQTRGAFESAHRDLTAFYARTAGYGDAVVKWLLIGPHR